MRKLTLIIVLLVAMPTWAGRSFSPLSATITAASLVSNVITFTASNSFTAGMTVYVSGLTGGCANLNAIVFLVLSTGLSSSQFEASYTLANESCSGQSGNALYGLIVIPAIGNALDIPTGPMTISLWVYPTTLPGGSGVWAAHWNGASGSQWAIGNGVAPSSSSTNAAYVIGCCGAFGPSYGACGTLVTNKWYQIVVFVDTVGLIHGSATTGMFVSGGITCSTYTAYTNDRTAGQANMTIGGSTPQPSAGNNAYSMTGIVGEVAVWNTLLATSSGTTPFMTALQTICPEGPSARRMGLPAPTAYFPLAGASDAGGDQGVEPDLSGNIFNGTLAGAVGANHPPCTP
jgi:concanavalin A-like lectin/glucanase superfamily protein